MTTPAADALGAEFILARFWEGKGKHERALEGFERVIREAPMHRLAHVGRVNVLLDLHRVDDAVTAAREGLALHTDESALHKSYVRALRLQSGSSAAAFAEYDLHRADARQVTIEPGHLLCVCVVRNEAARLPYFLDYYRRHGVDRFLIVDNGSTDGSLDYLRGQGDVYVWQSSLSFKVANFGSAWFEILLQEYGCDHWCLTVDADELLYFPDCETRTIAQLCRDLDCAGKRVMFAPLVDMYSDRPIRDTVYEPGQRFEDVCPFFDRRFFHRWHERSGPYRNQPMVFGGVRQRVFGAAPYDYLLSKMPLLKYSSEAVLAGGQHVTSYPESDIASETGCLLHFKFTSAFLDYAQREAVRREHAQDGFQYRQYARGLDRDDDLCLFDPHESVRLTNSRELEALGMMTRRRIVDAVKRQEGAAPEIPPIAAGIERPFWSVVITVFRRLDYLEQALASVVHQADRDMQIEVVQDGGVGADVREAAARLVQEVGGGRATFYGHDEQLGHPAIFNFCLRRARGYWVHLLHDDDWVEPGFYGALERGIESAPEVGAAICRWRFVDKRGLVRAYSTLERDTPGTIPNWLDRIAVSCRVQTPAIVVRRQAYEAVGGYSPETGSAFDWEMWQRLAVNYPVWYEPRPLASFRSHRAGESHYLIRTGQQVADARRAIEVASRYLPDEKRSLTSRALEQYGRYALRLVAQQMAVGDPEAALANIREALECTQTPALVSELAKVLAAVPAQPVLPRGDDQ